MQALNEEQTAALLKLSRGTWLHAPIFLAVTTGLRRGEMLGLRWDDIDLQAGQLSVRQSLEQTKTALTFKQPKTAKGTRIVALPPVTVETLRRHKADQAKNRLRLGPEYNDGGLVFARTDGCPLDPRSVSHAFMALIEKSDLPRIRLHDLRHTHATQLLRQGVHPKIVSERLGHSTVAITLDTYSHVLPGMQEEAAQLINAALKTALGTDYES